VSFPTNKTSPSNQLIMLLWFVKSEQSAGYDTSEMLPLHSVTEGTTKLFEPESGETHRETRQGPEKRIWTPPGMDWRLVEEKTGGPMVATISRDELKKKIDSRETFLLVETLPAATYHHAHLPGAINLPPDQLTELATKLLPDKAADIVVYCAKPTWNASENAARELATLGYTKVRDYAGGKQDWIDAGLPIESEHQHWTA
jgi:rhodanese-related sulfurtransferase